MSLDLSVCVPLTRPALFQAVGILPIQALDPKEIHICSDPSPYPDARDASWKRNQCLRKSNQPYILFVDDDVILSVQTVCTMVELLSQSPPDVVGVYCDHFHVGHPILGGGVYESGPYSRDRLKQQNYFSTMTVLRRAAVVAAGGWDESLTRYQDWDLWLTMTANGSRFLYYPQIGFTALYTSGITTNSGEKRVRKQVEKKHNL